MTHEFGSPHCSLILCKCTPWIIITRYTFCGILQFTAQVFNFLACLRIASRLPQRVFIIWIFPFWWNNTVFPVQSYKIRTARMHQLAVTFNPPKFYSNCSPRKLACRYLTLTPMLKARIAIRCNAPACAHHLAAAKGEWNQDGGLHLLLFTESFIPAIWHHKHALKGRNTRILDWVNLGESDP